MGQKFVRSFVAPGKTIRHYARERKSYEKSFICLIRLLCGWGLAGGRFILADEPAGGQGQS
jgi:hypothetical protein